MKPIKLKPFRTHLIINLAYSIDVGPQKFHNLVSFWINRGRIQTFFCTRYITASLFVNCSYSLCIWLIDYLSQMNGSIRLRISPTRWREPVHSTWTRSADFIHSGRPFINSWESSPFSSLESRPWDNHIRLSATHLNVRVGIGPLPGGEIWGICCSSTGDDLETCWNESRRGDDGWGTRLEDVDWRLVTSWEVTRSSQTERLSAQRRNWSSIVTFMLTRSTSALSSHYHSCCLYTVRHKKHT